MYEFLLTFHSYWAYLVIVFTVILLSTILYYYFTKKPLHHTIRKIAFYNVLSFHIQFLVGLSLLLFRIFNGVDDFSMSNAPMRFTFVEHPLMMFTAVMLMTIANSKIKKSQYVTNSILIFIVLAIVCFYMIPWEKWLHT